MKFAKTLFAATLAIAAVSAHAELIPGTTYSLDFQSGFIQASGKKINMFRVPVTDVTTNTTLYFDLTFDFNIGANGITFDRTSYAASSAVQATSVQNLVVGNYKDTAGTLFNLVKTTGLNDGRDQLSLISVTAAKVYSAKFATGPLTGHPMLGANSISACAAADTGVFGIVGTNNYCPGDTFTSNCGTTRLKQIDPQRIEYASVNVNSCVAYHTVILTKN